MARTVRIRMKAHLSSLDLSQWTVRFAAKRCGVQAALEALAHRQLAIERKPKQ
jgi:hypothetical protein